MRGWIPAAYEREMITSAWERLAALLCVVVLMAGCVGPKPAEKDPDAVPHDTKQQLASYNYNLARNFWERDRADLAMRYLNMAVRQDPEAAAPRLKIVDLYLLFNDADAAIAYLDECPESLREQPDFLKRRALALDLRAQGNEAEKLWSRLTAGEECEVNVLAVAAENLILQGKNKEALDLLKSAHNHYPMETVLLISLSDLCLAMELYGEEVEYRMALAMVRPDNHDYIREAARAFLRADQTEEGIDRIAWLNKGTQAHPDATVSAAMGYLYFCQGDYAAAAPHLIEAFQSNRYIPDREELLALAEIHLRNKAYPEAMVVLEKALEEDPEHELTRAALAWAYYCAGSKDQSRRVIMQAPRPMEKDGHLVMMKK
ncbi:MAG: tetratricopeptide repeat protein [Planctomycetota bacterium]